MQRDNVFIHDIKTSLFDYTQFNKKFKKMLKLISGNNSYKGAKIRIIDCCRDHFHILVTENEFKPLIYNRSKYPKNTMIILMAMYNILKSDYENNYKYIDDLANYIKNISTLETMIIFSLGNKPAYIIGNGGEFKQKYHILIQFLDDTSKTVNRKTSNSSMYNIVINGFPYDYFSSSDIN